MNTNFWHKKWQTNQIGFNQKKPNPLMQQYIKTLDLKPGDRIFVPLCGKSIDMLWLLEQGYEVMGVEVNEGACQAFFEEHKIPLKIKDIEHFRVYSHDNITLFCGDFFQLTPELLGHLDAVYDRAALIALPADLRQRYVTHLSQLLSPETRVLLITIAYDSADMQGPPFSVDEHDVTQLFSAQFDIQQQCSKPYTNIPEHLKARGLSQARDEVYELTSMQKNMQKKAYFAGGCFWGVEHLMQQQPGVLTVVSGYMGGHVENPSYNQVCQQNTGHVEAVEVLYNSNCVTYEQLAKLFFEIHDPTQHDGQGPDRGSQYASVIFYSCHEEKQMAESLIQKLEQSGLTISTRVMPAEVFWKAEESHQNYYEKHHQTPYCHRYQKRFFDV
ncbi:MAG: thiopurine S-methyltransferase [Legionellaceae bacterium]|nr:thiopurine S-methyltransferase [Legionellaceae bacterium]